MTEPAADAVAALAGRLAEAIAADDATAAGVAAVAGGDVDDDGPPLGLHASTGVPGVQTVTVTRRWNSEVPNAAQILLTAALPLADVEQHLGSGTPIPSIAPGRHVVELEAIDAPATLFAALDDEGRVLSITVRRDS
jgi:hypothetical protein